MRNFMGLKGEKGDEWGLFRPISTVNKIYFGDLYIFLIFPHR